MERVQSFQVTVAAWEYVGNTRWKGEGNEIIPSVI